jgi:hypothetical protein
MNYSELVRTYFERSTALQWYWTLYVVVIGGLLAISSFRRRVNFLLTVLVTVLYCCFAYKNSGAIGEVTMQRLGILQVLHALPTSVLINPETQRFREIVEPTLTSTTYEGARNFHIACDVLTIAALWAMERRRRRVTRHFPPAGTAP